MVDGRAARTSRRRSTTCSSTSTRTSTRLQVEIVAGFAPAAAAVTAVGDDFQAIYAFRSASARHILGLPGPLRGRATVTLERNYRATQPLLDVANAVAAQDAEGFPKGSSRAARGWRRARRSCSCRDQVHEAVEVSRPGAGCARGGHAAARAGGARAHRARHRRCSSSSCRGGGSRIVKYGGLRYLEAAHVKDLLAVLRLADRPATSWRGSACCSCSRASARPGAPGGRPAACRRPAVARELTERWATARAELPLSALELADAAGRRDRRGAARQRAGVRGRAAARRARPARARPLRRRRRRGCRISTRSAGAGRRRARPAHVRRRARARPAGVLAATWPGRRTSTTTGWSLSTVHSAKGLEWQSVHLLAAYDGNFPADMAAGTSESIDEERRLIYVALTRARRALAIYVPRRYYHRPRGRDDAARLRQGVAVPRRARRRVLCRRPSHRRSGRPGGPGPPSRGKRHRVGRQPVRVTVG